MKRKNRAPNNYGVTKRTASYEHVIQENCINAYVDGGNNIQAIWAYLNQLIAVGDVTEPFAKQQARAALDTIKSSERLYNKLIENRR